MKIDEALEVICKFTADRYGTHIQTGVKTILTKLLEAAPSTAPNTGSPKLPSEDEVWRYIRARSHKSHFAVAADVLAFIARQLRAGA